MRPQFVLNNIVSLSVTCAFCSAIAINLGLVVCTALGLVEMSEMAMGALVSMTLALINLMRELVKQTMKSKKHDT